MDGDRLQLLLGTDGVLKHKLSTAPIGNALHALRLASSRILHLLGQVGKRRNQVDVVPAARKPVINDPDDFAIGVNFAPYRDIERTPAEQGIATIARKSVIDDMNDYITCLYRVTSDDIARSPAEHGVADIAQPRGYAGPGVH